MQSTTHTDQAREHLEARLTELDTERDGVTTALEALSSTNGSAPARRGRPKAAKAGRKRGKRSGGNRAAEAVELVRANPGISASEIAAQMKIKPNYLYRVLNGLVEQKLLKKKGRKYEVAAKAKAAPAKAAKKS